MPQAKTPAGVDEQAAPEVQKEADAQAPAGCPVCKRIYTTDEQPGVCWCCGYDSSVHD